MGEVKKTTIQLIKYGVIGVSNTLITFVVFYIINTLAGLSENLANVLGYILGLINSFIWNRNWVFKTNNNWVKEAVVFTAKGEYECKAVVFAVGFLICFGLQFAVFNYLLNYTSLRELQISWLPMEKTGENVAMVIGMVVYTLCNYCFNRFVTFKDKK